MLQTENAENSNFLKLANNFSSQKKLIQLKTTSKMTLAIHLVNFIEKEKSTIWKQTPSNQVYCKPAWGSAACACAAACVGFCEVGN